MAQKQEMLWKDRKRILGMPISFTRYALSEDRLFIKTGLFNLEEEEVLLYRVRDLSVKRSFGQRIFGVGSVLVHSSDKSTPHLLLKNIKNADDVKEQLHQQVEKMKIERRVRLGELMQDDDPCDVGLEDDNLD
ncbi:MAG TPA: PH domain-containing protein [Candidatus Fimivicinus intestinavium]|nr:PH domain-containing protein [Candidatus Fimivicinus intestinavium]